MQLDPVWAELAKCRSINNNHMGPPASQESTDDLRAEFAEVCRAIRAAQAAGQHTDALVQRRHTLWERLSIRRVSGRRGGDALPEFDIQCLAGSLALDEAILYYFWIDRHTYLLATIDREYIATELRKVPESDRQALEEFAERVMRVWKSKHGFKWADRVQGFSSLLLPELGSKLLAGKQRLLISPHRLLHALPFHALSYEGAPLISRLR